MRGTIVHQKLEGGRIPPQRRVPHIQFHVRHKNVYVLKRHIPLPGEAEVHDLNKVKRKRFSRETLVSLESLFAYFLAKQKVGRLRRNQGLSHMAQRNSHMARKCKNRRK